MKGMPLPALRTGLDFMPSPAADQPGLLLRDPLGFSKSVLVVPPTLVPALSCLDGTHELAECQQIVRRLAGYTLLKEVIQQLVAVLQRHGFLETPEFLAMRAAREATFRAGPTREAAFAGKAYPDEPDALRRFLHSAFQNGDASSSPGKRATLGIAAPHVSPHGGLASYAAAYAALPELTNDDTLVILGTSHYGRPNLFGVTAKPFTTPLGRLECDAEALQRLQQGAPDALIREDYCHAVEHSIEFQCLFAQFVSPAAPRILPILCGALHDAPGDAVDPEVERFHATLRQIADRHERRLVWILGVDFAHAGTRYGDAERAVAETGWLQAVREEDQQRLRHVVAGDADGFRERVYDAAHLPEPLATAAATIKQSHDGLKWCGYSPLLTFLRVFPEARGRLLGYQQWNIDPDSVVSFGAMAFDVVPR